MTKKYQEQLQTMLVDMEKQDKLYKPTSFWRDAIVAIAAELPKNSLENFRKIDVTRNAFVPGYSAVEYLAHPEKYDVIIDEFDKLVKDKRFTIRLKRLFTGYTSVFNEYRVLRASNINKKPYTDKVSESNIGNPIEQTKLGGRYFSRSFMNYLLGLNFLKQNVDTDNINTVMEIGGGYGTLGEILLKESRNDIFYINADIPPVSFISSYYLQKLFGKNNIATYENLKDFKTLDIKKLRTQYKALNICSWQVPRLKGKIDLFVNFISFQEMEPSVVANYCKYIDLLEPKYILLRNIAEGKAVQKDNLYGVEKPIIAEDYDDFLPNYKLIASDSEIFGFVTEDNFHSQLRIYARFKKGHQ